MASIGKKTAKEEKKKRVKFSFGGSQRCRGDRGSSRRGSAAHLRPFLLKLNSGRLSPRWKCELKECWETLHLACQAVPPPTTQMFSPSSTPCCKNIPPMKENLSWRVLSRDSGWREEKIYRRRKAAFTRRVLIHQRAEHQVHDERHVQCSVHPIILQNLVVPCCSSHFSLFSFYIFFKRIISHLSSLWCGRHKNEPVLNPLLYRRRGRV